LPRAVAHGARGISLQTTPKTAPIKESSNARGVDCRSASYDKDKDVDMVGWINRAIEYRKTHPKINAPALA
jgi:hypothetical protein